VSASELEALAEQIYHGFVLYEMDRRRFAHPRWFALDPTLQNHWRRVARETAAFYERYGSPVIAREAE
jgi:hypothetical protein